MIARKKPAITNYHLARAGVAGLAAGYAMALSGYWLQAVLGVSELDFAHAGLRYVSGAKPGWWIVGIVFHLIDSVLLGLLYARVVYRPLDWLVKAFGRFWGNLASGIAYATAVWLVLAMLIAMPFMGAGIFARKTG